MNKFSLLQKISLGRVGIPILFILSVLVLATACTTAAGKTAIISPSADFTIEVTETGIIAPEQLPTGPVAITFKNLSQIPRAASIARLNGGVTVEEVTAALAGENPMAALAMVQLLGGTEVAPDASRQIVYDLKEADHLVLLFGGNDGPPPIATFQAVGTSGSVAAPKVDVKAELKDFAFLMPDQIKAGPQTWQIENSGEQWHELLVVKLHEGVTLGDVAAMMHQEGEAEGPPLFEPVAVFTPLAQGERAWVTFDLEPGQYTAICGLPDLAGGIDKSHLDHGMIRQLTVTD